MSQFCVFFFVFFFFFFFFFLFFFRIFCFFFFFFFFFFFSCTDSYNTYYCYFTNYLVIKLFQERERKQKHGSFINYVYTVCTYVYTVCTYVQYRYCTCTYISRSHNFMKSATYLSIYTLQNCMQEYRRVCNYSFILL